MLHPASMSHFFGLYRRFFLGCVCTGAFPESGIKPSCPVGPVAGKVPGYASGGSKLLVVSQGPFDVWGSQLPH